MSAPESIYLFLWPNGVFEPRRACEPSRSKNLLATCFRASCYFFSEEGALLFATVSSSFL